MANNQTTVKVTADASGYTAEIDRARKSAEAFQQTQAQAAERVRVAQEAIAQAATNGSNASAKAINNFVSQLARQADQAGKTRAELLQMKAAQLGIADSVSGYINKISEASKHTHEFSIASSSARREMLVLAHEASQGSWTKFGGSLLVLGERTDALTLLFSSAGLTAGIFAGAVAGLAIAAIKGAAEAKELNAALVLTSNYAGLTSQAFADMEARVSGSTNTGLGKVGTVLRGLAASGQYTASEMESLSQVIVRTSEISGASLEDVSKHYEKLAEDPAKWAYEHNESMHLMDTATYQHIQALQEAGDKHKAVQVIIEAAAAQVESSSEKHLSVAAQAWRTLSTEVDTFWSKVKQGLSTGASLQDKIDTLAKEREEISSNPLAAGRIGEINKQIAALGALQKAENEKAAADAKAAAQRQAGIEAAQRIDRMRDQVMTNAQKREKELAQLARDRAAILADGGKFSDSDYQSMVSGINSKYKDAKPHSNSEAYHGQLAQMTAANQLIEAEEKRHEAQLKAQRDAGLIDSETYLRQLNDIQSKALDQEIGNAQKRVDIARSKPESAAYQEALKDLQKLQGQRADLERSLNDALLKLQAQRTANVQRFSQQEAAGLGKQQAGYFDADSMRFATSQMKSDYDARAQLVAQYNQQVSTLKEQYDSPTADQQEYTQKLALANQYFDLRLTALQEHLAKEQAVRESYSDQMHLAFVKLGGDGQTYAQTAATAFTTAWQDSSNALDTFLTTGKGNFEQFTASILADLAKIALHAAEMQIFQSIGTSFFSTGGDVGHYADGGSIAGAGTGTSDSIPAMLSNGEYVIRASQARKYHSLLDSINNGRMSHFAGGGVVGTSAGGGSSGGGSPVSVVVHNNGGGGLTDTDAKELHTLVSAFVDKRMGQAMRGQGGYAYQMRYNQI